MLISLPEIINKHNLNIKGVIQVGAHWAEEHEIFVGLGIENIVYIEPCKEAFKIMSAKLGVSDYAIDNYINEYIGHSDDTGLTVALFNSACGEEEGEFTMYVSNNNQGQSNSLLKPMLHIQQHPEVIFNEYETVKVIQLDRLPFEKQNYNLLVMDCQGAEGLVLKGATETLKHIDCIYTEINTDQTYEGNMLIGEMDEYLSEFVRVETFMPSPNWSWGDSVFIRKTLLQ